MKSTLNSVSSAYDLDLQRFGLDTATLAGTLDTKLAAARDAGFTQLMVWAKDLAAHPEGLDATVRIVRTSGLRVTGLQLLRDAEGLEGPLRAHKMDVAASALALCRAVGAPVLLVSSSTSAHASADADAVAFDLAELASMAAPLDVRIAYEALSWGRHVGEYAQAWDIVERAGHANLGIVIDSFHLLARQASFDALERIPPERIALVQLSDFMWPALLSAAESMDTARHQRVFPGEGVHSVYLAELLRRLQRIGYRGDYSFEVVNDDFLQMPAASVVARARCAAGWLIEQADQNVTSPRSPT
jgi:2-keto-myo-inositol isomerase